ncbi:MAG: YigZ family protein [Acutalibacteraceae bacterium]|nr:YigZ family protein [Acutalibacteraceae bacterium]
MADNSYKTVLKEANDEFIEKRSRFIGYCKPVSTEEEALEFINKIKTKHWDARHNVYAYCLREGQIKRYSDDGEPQGTAGVPVLDVLVKSNLTDLVVVVTRYFGGVLLGAGGLVRAYSHSAKIATEASSIVTMQQCAVCTLTCDYNQYGKVSSLIPQCGGFVDNSDFGSEVEMSFHIAPVNLEMLKKSLADATCGEVEPVEEFMEFFATDCD